MSLPTSTTTWPLRPQAPSRIPAHTLRPLRSGGRRRPSAGGRRRHLFLDDWADYIAEAGGHALDRGDLDPGPVEAIRTENVSYSYADSARPALDRVSVEV